MTQKSIARQIEVIREVTAKASVSKEAALSFLSRAGIKETPKKSEAIVSAKKIK